MRHQDKLPSDKIVCAILDILAPDYESFAVHQIAASYSNHTHQIDATFTDKPQRRLILRRYNVDNGYVTIKARREFNVLKQLQQSEIPIPKPLYLDDEGKVLGTAGIVTEFVSGSQIDIGLSPNEWASKADTIANALAQIHTTTIDEKLKPVLMDANREILWFLKGEKIPNYMKSHPDGEVVWQTVVELLPEVPIIEPVLLHLDFWSGNILWDEGQISAIVDWEEAACGDPAIDVAYCRMEFFLEGLDEAAEQFLKAYENATGEEIANLGFWELAASVRPMYIFEDWMRDDDMKQRFRQFITNALKKATS